MRPFVKGNRTDAEADACVILLALQNPGVNSAAMQIVLEGSSAPVQWTTDGKPDTLKEGMQPMLDQIVALLTEQLGVA